MEEGRRDGIEKGPALHEIEEAGKRLEGLKN
jgi:hypothetical protein